MGVPDPKDSSLWVSDHKEPDLRAPNAKKPVLRAPPPANLTFSPTSVI